MVDVCELVKFTANDKVLRLVMDIAAALERYRIAMEGPVGVRLRKLNRHRSQVAGDAAPFVEFMLNVILRTIKVSVRTEKPLRQSGRPTRP